MQTKKYPVTVLDALVLTAVLGFFAFIAYRLFFALNYKWNWAVIPTYMVRFDAEQQRWTANILLEGFLTTIKLSLWGTLLAVLLGFFIGLCRISPQLLPRLVGRTYVEAIRNTPPLVLVFIFYYFVSDQLLAAVGIEALFRTTAGTTRAILTFFFAEPHLINQFLSGVLTLALFQGAYIAEIVRAGIQAIDTIFSDVSDMEGLRRETELIKRIGYTGKCMVNPRQIEVIHDVFAPKQEEVDYALQVIEAIKRARLMGTGVISLAGKMIDAPVVKRAGRVLRTAYAHGLVDEIIDEEVIHGSE